MDPTLQKIRDFADRAHGEQLRKYSPDRYIVHPVRVMEICRDYDRRLPVLAAALLHDVLEDTAVKEDELRDFLLTLLSAAEAEKTISLVIDLTDVYVKAEFPKMNRRQRKDKELERIAKTSGDSQTVKYADIIDNSSEIASADPDFAPRYLRESLAILRKADRGNRELRERAIATVESCLREV